jgi:post-segregation antitoxin (ccd killing protein)
MPTLSLRLPESVQRKLAELAKAEGVSLNQLLSSAAAEKLAALMTEQYLTERAKRGSRKNSTQYSPRCPPLLRSPETNCPTISPSALARRRANSGLQLTSAGYAFC